MVSNSTTSKATHGTGSTDEEAIDNPDALFTRETMHGADPRRAVQYEARITQRQMN